MRRIALLILCLPLFIFPPQKASSGELDQKFHIEAVRWPEAEKLFRTDPRWMGGDGASSVDLRWSRVLWLFGDSLIDRSGSRSRQKAVLVRNSIAVQTGYDPTMARMKFSWKTKGRLPDAFFRQEGAQWFWPASGIMINDRLLIFLMKVRKAGNDLGFEPCGWEAVLVTEPEKDPAGWRLKYLDSPQKGDILVGSGSAVVSGGYVHVFSTDWRDRKVYLVRWPSGSAYKGNLSRPQWWAGGYAGWVSPSLSGPRPRAVFSGGQTEFSVEYVPRLKQYVQVQTFSLMNPCLAVCTSPALTGPWSARDCFYSPAGMNLKDLLIYAGKSHPGVQGADMIFTYVANSQQKDRLMSDTSLYYPVVLKGTVIRDRRNSPGTAMAMNN